MKKILVATVATVALVLTPAAADASPKHKTHKAKTVSVWSGGMASPTGNQGRLYVRF